MIISFGSKETEQIWNGIRVKKMPIEIQNVGRRKLRMLNNSQDIADLRIPPSNRVEKLTGKLKDFYSPTNQTNDIYLKEDEINL